eukprot:jgi/Mesvir1/20879/Mv07957-RA.1
MDPMMLRRILPALLLLMLMLWDVSIRPAGSTIFVVTSENATFTFFDAEATFGSAITPGGIEGVLIEANPLDACAPLQNSDESLGWVPDRDQGVVSGPTMAGPLFNRGTWFALVIRGSCSFEQKVLNAQNAGADAVIVFDNERNRELIRMAGRNVADIIIPAVFVDNRAGRQLQFLLQSPGTRVWIVPTIEDTSLSALAVAFIATVCVTAVMASFFFMRRRQAELAAAGAGARADAPVGLSAAEIKLLPTLVFKSVQRDPEAGAGESGDSSWSVCAVCLEEYANGDKLRLLPCRHEFHSACIDPWLMSRRTCCPVCKREVMPSLAAASSSASSTATGAATSSSGGASASTIGGPSNAVSERMPLLRDQPGPSGVSDSCGGAPSASSAPAAVSSLAFSTPGTTRATGTAANAGALGSSPSSSSTPEALGPCARCAKKLGRHHRCTCVDDDRSRSTLLLPSSRDSAAHGARGSRSGAPPSSSTVIGISRGPGKLGADGSTGASSSLSTSQRAPLATERDEGDSNDGRAGTR